MLTASVAPHIKSFTFQELKADDTTAGSFSGYLSVFGNLDSYKDIVEPGAFQKTINDARGRGGKYLFPVLWQHDPSEPIGGFLEMREDRKGLWVRGQLDLDTEKGKRAYSGLQKGYLDGLSIGYDTIKQKYAGEIRHLLEVRMWEGSIVTFPANPDTRVVGVKTACGSTSFPLASRDTAWDAAKARSQYQTWATDAQGELVPSKLKQVHFYVDESADPKTIGAYGLPFCYIADGSPQAVPKGVQAVAGVLQGARGAGSYGSDEDTIKAKVASYYNKMKTQFNDPDIVVPWKKKARDFQTVLSDRAPSEAMEDLYDLLSAFMTVMMETMGDCPDAATCTGLVTPSLKQFQQAVLSWIDDAFEAGLGSDESEMKQMTLAHFGVSARALKTAVRAYTKEGRALSSANRSKISTALDTISAAVKELQSLLESTNIYKPGDSSEEVAQPANTTEKDASSGERSPIGPLVPVKKSEEDEQIEVMLAWLRERKTGMTKGAA